MKALVKRNLTRMLRSIGCIQSETRMTSAAERYWQEPSTKHALNSHWREAMEPGTWEAIGRFHRELYERFVSEPARATRIKRMIEWGCGGGANAVAFADLVDEFIGVDLSKESLTECGRQLSAYPAQYTPQLVTAAHPEAILDSLTNSIEFFLCTFVFELLPSEALAERILKVAYASLQENGAAMIQVKYATDNPATKSRRFGYRWDLANTTTFRIEQFWELAQGIGFSPRCVHLLPQAPLVHDERYAYFFLERPPTKS